MQRYRVVIMLVLFGVLPVVAAFFVALSFLGEEEPEATRVEVAPVAEEPLARNGVAARAGGPGGGAGAAGRHAARQGQT